MTIFTVKRAQLFLFVLILGFLLGPRVIEAIQRLGPDNNAPVVLDTKDEKMATSSDSKLKIVEIEDPYKALLLYTKSAYVWDAHTHRKLFDVNGTARLPLASVAKIMMALVATETLPPDAQITIMPEDILEEGDTGLSAGEIWTLKQLLSFTLVASSNDGASAIAEAAGAYMGTGTSTDRVLNKKLFVQKMNERARTLGLSQTSFYNESGLDVGQGMSGAYGSPRDMAMLFEYVFHKHPEIFTSTSYAELDLRSASGIVHHVANTNQEVEHITGIIGSKTGFTDLAGGNLVVIVDIGINHPVVIAVLGSTREDRFSDVRQLIAATTEAITHSAVLLPSKK